MASSSCCAPRVRVLLCVHRPVQRYVHRSSSRSVACLSPVTSALPRVGVRKRDLLEKNEARRRAEEFGRTLTDHWEEWAFEIGLWATPAVTGIYGFAW